MIGELPKSLNVNGSDYSIRSDFRDVLKILCAFNDPNLSSEEKIYVCLCILYKDFDCMEQTDYHAAFEEAMRFISNGREPKEKGKTPRVMDWEQDEQILFPAINKIAGCEVRLCDYVHWWTFLGFYLSINDGVFSQVLRIRSKKARGQKLEKWEQEYWNTNKDICVLKPRLSAEEQEAKDRLNALLD